MMRRIAHSRGSRPTPKPHPSPSASTGPSRAVVRHGQPQDRTSRGAGIDGGFGVDWFPVDQMSIGGWTGLRFSNDRAENDDTTSRFRTVTTGLRVHLYF